MSVYSLMRTGASGMGAQSDRLSAVADNIANSSTVGYKAAGTEFSSLLINSTLTSYSSGGVETAVRHDVSKQGTLSFTNSPFDLAINGKGFMLVRNQAGHVALSRAGAFVPDNEGRLVNSSGYQLLGYPSDDRSVTVANGTDGLVPVRVKQDRLEAVPTTGGEFTANLPASTEIVDPIKLPSTNGPNSITSQTTSMVTYDNQGRKVLIDLQFAKSGPNQWEVCAFNAADRANSGTFPYSSVPLVTTTLTFDAHGRLIMPNPGTVSVPVPGGEVVNLDLANITQLASDYSVLKLDLNGNSPGAAAAVTIDNDGTIYETYDSGARHATYRIPLAGVVSEDRLLQQSGNVFEPTSGSSDLTIGTAGTASLGRLISGALESSTADIAAELTTMIEAQRNYTANSKVFQTGAELLETLVNLKR